MEILTKICTKCKKELPLTKEYFSIDNNTKTKFSSACKICKGDSKTYGSNRKFTWTYELEKLLIELHFKYTHQYIIDNYSVFKGLTKKSIGDKLLRLRKKNPELDLYKNDSHRNLHYEYWTKEQEEELIKIYPYMTNEEIVNLQLFRNFTVKKIINKIKRINLEDGKEIYKTKDTLSRTFVESQKKLNDYNKEHGLKRRYSMSDVEKQNLKNRASLKWSGKNNPRHINPLFGSDNGRWDGGVKPTTTMLRDIIFEWKYETMKSNNFKCVVTGDKFDIIHHMYPFNKIVKECFNNLNIEFKDTINYTDLELSIIRDEFIKLHNSYGLGVCLKNYIHIEFHKEYGYVNFTKEDFYEFCKTKYNVVLE